MWQYTDAGIRASEQESSAVTDDDSDLTPDNCKYVLKGVLVHSGTANSGHYYSFIKERSGDADTPEDALKWWQFIDETVSEFSEKSLPDECFGGFVGARGTKTRPTVRSRELTNNAFMLFYDRMPAAKTADVAAPLPQSDSVIGLASPVPKKRRRVQDSAALQKR